jgi:GH24 family phage-related lysozyme (muramidase)
LWEFLNFLASFYNEESMRYSFFKTIGNQTEFEFTEKTAKELYLAIISDAKKNIANTISKDWVYTTVQATVIEFIKNTGKITIDTQPIKSNTNTSEIKQKVSAVKTQTSNKTTPTSSPKKNSSLKDSAKTYADSPIAQLFKDAGVVESFKNFILNEDDTEKNSLKLLRTELDGMDATDIYNKLSKKDNTFILPSDSNINQMNANDLCYRFIATFEGYTEGIQRDEAVTDREVYQTGFGLVVPKDSKGVSSKAEAMDLLIKYCNQRITPKFREWVKKYRYVLNQNMINGLYSFAYNLGEGKLEKLTNGTSTPAGPRNEITLPYGMKLYTKASGSTNQGLKWRREAEVAMYNGEIKDESSFNSFMSSRNKMKLISTSGDSKIEKTELVKPELKKPGEMPQQLSPELGGNTPSMPPR